MQCHIQYYVGREYYEKLCMYRQITSHGITEMCALEKNYTNRVIIQLHQVLGMIYTLNSYMYCLLCSLCSAYLV